MITKKASNVWFVRVFVRFQGQPQRRQAVVTGTRAEALAKEAELKKEIRQGLSKRSLKISETFSDCLDFFLSHKKMEYRGAPHSYFEILRKAIGHVKIDHLDSAFEDYLRQLKRSVTRSGESYAVSSLNRLINCARTPVKYAYEHKLIKTNPFVLLKTYSGAKVRDRYLDLDERNRLLTAIDDVAPYLRPLVEYNLAVPCRKGELLGRVIRIPGPNGKIIRKVIPPLGREAYNHMDNTISVPDSKSGLPLKKPVPLHMRAYFRNIPPECPYLFYRQDKTGHYYPLGDFKNAWRSCLKRAGIADFKFHDLRHVSSTDMYDDLKVPERVIMDICGWKTQMLTKYRHKDSLKSAQAINKIYEEKETKCIPLRIPSDLRANEG